MFDVVAIIIQVFSDRSVFVKAYISQVLFDSDLKFAFGFSYSLFHTFCACKGDIHVQHFLLCSGLGVYMIDIVCNHESLGESTHIAVLKYKLRLSLVFNLSKEDL